FLAELFISPDRQGQGIGNALLGRMLDHAQACGATCKALLTFTFNRTSQALYIRHGTFPRCPVYMFGAARDAVLKRLPAQKLQSVPLENTEAHRALLAQIDVSALGVSRARPPRRRSRRSFRARVKQHWRSRWVLECGSIFRCCSCPRVNSATGAG